MIGNDVIDLALAKKESNWKRKGFLDKIFTKREQLLILQSQSPETAIWNLWSRKEAAYKIYNRQTKISAYIPLQLECFDLEVKEGIVYGKVSCYNSIYFTKTIITLDCIETIAVTTHKDFDKIKYAESTDKIAKINGIPNYLNTENKKTRPASKSHHGRFEKTIWLHS